LDRARGEETQENVWMECLYASTLVTTCMSACEVGTHGQGRGILGRDIAVLKLPQTCSSPNMSGRASIQTCGNTEINASSVGGGRWEREICAWRSVRVERLGKKSWRKWWGKANGARQVSCGERKIFGTYVVVV